MKNIFKILILLVGIVSFSSCDDYLSETPDSRIELNDLDKVAQLITNAYPSGSYLFLEGMTDNAGAVPSNMQITKMKEAFCWKSFSSEGQDTPSYYWSNAYKAVAHANQALKVLKELKGEKWKHDALRGEALMARAYSHFIMVNMFAKHYDATTASSDLGIPYITNPEKTLVVKYKRETVEETYRLIEKDILDGLKLINNNLYKNSGKYHFTREAALALASRFYLFKGMHRECLKYSNMLLGDKYNSVYIKDYQKVLLGQGPAGRAQLFNSTDDKSNLLIIRKKLSYQLYYHVGYRLTSKIFGDLFLQGVRSKNVWAANADQSAVYQSKYESLIERQSLTSSSGLPYTIQTVLRADEVYFNKLESLLAITAQESDANNKKLLLEEIKLLFNPYVMDRYNVPSKYNDKQLYLDMYMLSTREAFYKGSKISDLDLLKEMILKERRREFCEEGLRWFDIKRFGLEIEHIDVDEQKYVLKADDARKVLQIPASAILTGIKENIIEVNNTVPSKLIVR